MYKNTLSSSKWYCILRLKLRGFSMTLNNESDLKRVGNKYIIKYVHFYFS